MSIFNLLFAYSTENIGHLLAYSFILPFFSIGIVLLVVGIVYMRAKSLRLALITGLVVSLVLFGFSPSLESASIPAILGTLVGIKVLIDLRISRNSSK